jgi:hypothetical protein
MLMTAANPVGLWEVAETIRQCIHDELEENATGGAPGRSCVIWGAIAWDDCECGQLTVALGRQFPTGNSPNEGSAALRSGAQHRQSKCGFPIWGQTLTASILRCAPVQDGQGNAPTCEALSEAALRATEDAWRVRNAVVCCLRGLNADGVLYEWAVTGQDAVGPQGACQGSALTMNVFVDNWCNCVEGS